MSNKITVSIPIDSPEVRDALNQIFRPIVKEEISTALLNFSNPQQEEVLSRGQAAKLLNVCPITLSKLFHSGEIHGKWVGSRLKFLRSDIELHFRKRERGTK